VSLYDNMESDRVMNSVNRTCLRVSIMLDILVNTVHKS
jgi:hypothetical protein